MALGPVGALAGGFGLIAGGCTGTVATGGGGAEAAVDERNDLV